MNNEDKSAFSKSAFYHPSSGWDSSQDGLTKREYFAGLAMQGVLASGRIVVESHNVEYIIKFSIKAADELLKQLEDKK